MTIMTNKEFVAKLTNVAACTTLYVMGGFGQVLTDTRKKKLINQYEYNKNHETLINSMPSNSFAFDCIGLVKGVLWGFDCDTDEVYGGATYKSNGVPDCTEKKMLTYCSDVSTDLTSIEIGEYLWMEGHCGIYVGNDEVIESSPSFGNKVQYTVLAQRAWVKHGKLPWIEYLAKPTLDDIENKICEAQNTLFELSAMLREYRTN